MKIRILLTRAIMNQTGKPWLDQEWASEHNGRTLFALADEGTGVTQVRHYIEFVEEQDATAFRLRFGL